MAGDAPLTAQELEESFPEATLRVPLRAAYRIGLVHDLAQDEMDLDEKIGNIIDAIMLAGPVAQREAKDLIGKTVGIAGFEKIQALKRILPHSAREGRFIRSFIDEARIAVELTGSSTPSARTTRSIGRTSKSWVRPNFSSMSTWPVRL